MIDIKRTEPSPRKFNLCLSVPAASVSRSSRTSRTRSCLSCTWTAYPERAPRAPATSYRARLPFVRTCDGLYIISCRSEAIQRRVRDVCARRWSSPRAVVGTE
ncbi:hypothetical protein EVAR_78588_1 [Eumeta japonica]|uniref:Uncharacterized protein n=1 Tax=Eumeta variegata TaxID=151549 RepID=A0A4C1U7P8_EUMVA|nr:hypothetical protein EVAR_78588_1 [Eumeta japonica]